MIELDKIVNFKKNPIITSQDYINDCCKKIKNNSILKLDNFLKPNVLLLLQKEALNLQKKAYYCSQKHTILLTKKN